MIQSIRSLLAIGIAAFAVVHNVNAQDHGHINVGAANQTPGSKLIFANGADFATNTSYIKTLTFTNAARYAGYFQGNTTLTALPATPNFGGPDPQAPALGSYIFAQLASLEGPEGGQFGFWEAGAVTPTYSINSGETGTNIWRLTEADGSPGTDPFGHIHGRRWTLTKPGIYKVGFRALDLSTNGVDGGAIHMPSDILYTYVQAGVNIVSVELQSTFATIRFTAPLGTNWQLEASDNLTGTIAWTPMTSLAGDDAIHEFVDERPTAVNRFYRVRELVPVP